MGYRRLFIMRKDLHMSAGKLAAQIAHCAEAYWTRMIEEFLSDDIMHVTNEAGENISSGYLFCNILPEDIVNNYLRGSFTKTICEARNKAHLLKAKEKAESLGLKEDKDFGLIYDACYTELTPEENDGTTLTGIWFKPLPDEDAHKISKKYQLYREVEKWIEK